MGVKEILNEWTAWRTECIRRRVFFELKRMKERLHLLKGLSKILLDIDRAIAIIRNTEEDAEVIPNLMIGFGIDEVQANFIAEIKLRNINKEYILKRLDETSRLEKDIAEAESILKSKAKIRDIIIKELGEVRKKYAQPRKTEIVYAAEDEDFDEAEQIEDYPVHYFLTRDGYFKKVTPLSLRMSGEHKLKEGDELVLEREGSNADDLLFFTNNQQVYKVRCSEMEETKISTLGTYIPQRLGFDEGESVVGMAIAPRGEYVGALLFVFENGKVARVPLSAYETKTNRKRLTAAYCDKSPLVSLLELQKESEIMIVSSAGRALIFSSAALTPKVTRTTAGVNVMTLKAKHKITRAIFADQSAVRNRSRYKTRNLPAAGAILKPEDEGIEQTALE
jgi:DNA gyrase subunit A